MNLKLDWRRWPWTRVSEASVAPYSSVGRLLMLMAGGARFVAPTSFTLSVPEPPHVDGDAVAVLHVGHANYVSFWARILGLGEPVLRTVFGRTALESTGRVGGLSVVVRTRPERLAEPVKAEVPDA